jgi:ABC-type branched-subunit amino acid transport system permease subunit
MKETTKKTSSLLTRLEAFTSKYKLILGVVGAIVLVGFPQLLTTDYLVRVFTMVGIYMALAMSLNMLTGNLGLMSMGHAGFVGIGAYTGAILIAKVGGWQILTAAPIGTPGSTSVWNSSASSSSRTRTAPISQI